MLERTDWDETLEIPKLALFACAVRESWLEKIPIHIYIYIFFFKNTDPERTETF